MLRATPFRYEEPLPGSEEIVDREAELGMLSARALEGRNTRLAAPRRFGKTSLLTHLIAATPSSQATGIYVDLYGVIGAPDVVARLERALRAAKLPRGHSRWLEGRLRTTSQDAHMRVGPLTVSRSRTTGPPGAAEPGALEDRFAIFAELQQRIATPVIVVLDEFQTVLAGPGEADATIRSVIQHHDRVGYVFAGSHVGMMRELFADRSRPFYAQAAPLDLGPLPPGPLAEYAGARFERHHRGCDRVLGSLLDLSRGHPQRSMMLAAHLFEHTPEGSTADEGTLEEALSSAMKEADGELQSRWDALPLSRRRALAALAHGEPPFSKTASLRQGTSKGATGKALAALAASGDVASGEESGWTIIDPFMQEWIRRLAMRG
jgi:hypothetical protein